MAVRGYMTNEEEEDVHVKGYCHIKKAYTPRSPKHFRVDQEGTPHLFEASYQGVHVYPSVYGRLFEDEAYDEYSTIAVRALQGIDRTSEYMEKLEDWIRRTRGTAFEAEAPLHELFSEEAGGVDTMHCAELVTETLKVLDLVSPRFVGGTAPPCTYADAPFGSVNLRVGSFGPLEIVKADTESLEVLEDPLNFLSK